MQFLYVKPFFYFQTFFYNNLFQEACQKESERKGQNYLNWEKELSEKWGRSIIGTEYLTKEKDYGKNVSKLREYFK